MIQGTRSISLLRLVNFGNLFYILTKTNRIFLDGNVKDLMLRNV